MDCYREEGDVELELNSRVVTVALSGTVSKDIRVEMVLRIFSSLEDMPEEEGWEAACGAASASGSTSAWTTAWDLRACAVLPHSVSPNNGSYLGCSCRRAGTFAALLVTRSSPKVNLSCLCVLLFSCKCKVRLALKEMFIKIS